MSCFFQKSEFVTFLDLVKADLMQKIRKKNDGKYENFLLQTDGRDWIHRTRGRVQKSQTHFFPCFRSVFWQANFYRIIYQENEKIGKNIFFYISHIF